MGLRTWWNTSCQTCRRYRAIVLWGLLMLILYFVLWG